VPIAGIAAPPRVVRGRINSDGTIAQGTGFTATRTAAGSYRVTFTTAFGAAPIVVVTDGTTSGTVAARLKSGVAVTTTQFEVTTYNSTFAATDGEFTFFAGDA